MARGDGAVYRRGGRWWIAYYVRDRETGRSRQVREPGGPAERDARRRLRQRRGEALAAEAGGSPFWGPAAARVTFGALLDALVADYETQGRRSARDLALKAKRMKKTWGGRPAVAVTAAAVQEYAAAMKAEGYAAASINRDLAALRRAFRLAVEQGRLPRGAAPTVRLLPERNARRGFFERAEFEAVLKAVGNADVRDFLEWFFWTGMRPGSIRALTWRDLDAETWTLRLHQADEKTGRGLSLRLTGKWLEIIQRRRRARRLDSPYIFHWGGRPMGDFRRRWRAACEAAGVGDRLIYDLRRTAVRNLVRAGVPERVAMAISGHRTRSVFERYNITADEDLVDAREKLEVYVMGLPAERKVAGIRSER